MAYTPNNNPYIPGDPYSYDLKWIVSEIKRTSSILSTLDEKIAEAITRFLDQHDPVYYANASELIASDIKPGSLAYIMGYHTQGDGGANLYYVTDDYNDIISAPFYITLSGANRWTLPIILTPYVTPEMFGAYGDGAEDDADAFNAAFKSGNVVYIGNKIYVIKSPITLRENTSVICQGTIMHDISSISGYRAVIELADNCNWSGGTFIGTGAVSGYADTLSVIRGVQIKNSRLTDAIITDTPHWQTVVFEECEDILVENIIVKEYTNSGIAFLRGCKNSTIKGCRVINGRETTHPNRYAIMGNGDYAGMTPYLLGENIVIEDNYIEDDAPYWEGIDFHGCNGVVIRNNTIINTFQGIAVVGDPAYENYDVIVEGNNIELPATGTPIASRNNGGVVATRAHRMIISNNIIKNPGTLSTSEIIGAAIQLSIVENIQIINNIMLACSGDGVYFNSGNRNEIRGNIIEGVSAATPKTFEFDGSCDKNVICDNRVMSFLRAIYGPAGNEGFRNYFYKNFYDASVSYSNVSYLIPDAIIASLIPNIKCGEVGDVIFNKAASAGNPMGWICTSAGSSGTPAVWTALANV